MTAPAPQKCDVCGASPVELVLYPIAIHYKGSGFYTTDYGKGGKKPAPGKEGDSSKAPSSGGDSSGSGSDSGSSGSESKKPAEA